MGQAASNSAANASKPRIWPADDESGARLNQVAPAPLVDAGTSHLDRLRRGSPKRPDGGYSCVQPAGEGHGLVKLDYYFCRYKSAVRSDLIESMY